MDPPPAPEPSSTEAQGSQPGGASRTQSFSQRSDDSHTAAEFIDNQLQLEADAREALPYKFDNCTKTLGKLRQVLFSCLTCNPPPPEPTGAYNPAGVCYSCSIQCHGDHTLVELFNKRDFVCDCRTTRLPTTAPCTLRIHSETNTQGGVHSEAPETNNKYNQNFQNRFCGCECDYDVDKQKGTMFQCLGLGTAEEGGCGEDWWHPGCIVGLGPDWFETASRSGTPRKRKTEGLLESITEVAEAAVEAPSSGAPESAPLPGQEAEDDDVPLPPGFPEEDDFEGFICYKCVDANPWIKRYAGAPGFLAPVFRRSAAPSPECGVLAKAGEAAADLLNPKKRKADDGEDSDGSGTSKRRKEDSSDSHIADNKFTGAADSTVASGQGEAAAVDVPSCKVKALPPPPAGQVSLFFKSDFRDHLCHCSDCFPDLKKYTQLLEEEEIYEPELSEVGDEDGGSTVGSGSIYDRGESALKNVDRVRAIEGVMAYNHLKDKLKPFFQQFAESGKAISAEDIKAHFAKMRGDEQAIKDAGAAAKDDSSDNRREQSGY
ncbi:metaphase-anaphase transition protein-like protein mlo2 [Halenospora varia]|nr:metaphase-anaphase transition protein-like protein mlo2 [Halenospora varia]